MKALLLIILISLSICNLRGTIKEEDETLLKGYALFAQRVLVLTGMINSVQMQQAQRADEQLRLAMQTTNLQRKQHNTRYI